MGKTAKEFSALKSSFHTDMRIHAIIPVEAAQIQLDTWWEWRANAAEYSPFAERSAAGRCIYAHAYDLHMYTHSLSSGPMPNTRDRRRLQARGSTSSRHLQGTTVVANYELTHRRRYTQKKEKVNVLVVRLGTWPLPPQFRSDTLAEPLQVLHVAICSVSLKSLTR